MTPLSTLWSASAETRADSDDPALAGRTYAVPYERVWRTAFDLASGDPRWRIVGSDDQTGTIVAEATRALLPGVDDVRVRISLDADAQTRVDMASEARSGRADLGANRRRIRAFMSALDRELGA